ncbi:MAG TPA: methylmalonyl-CoA mutase family protein, partial [Planctomycetota bacterium]|nr:methylmalonyl-CoA mutase family protein [Planctomycetota bacterium]
EEIAKLRAARRIWARHMRERYGAKDPRSWMLRFHTQTAGSTLTAQQPENNVVRVALQALAATLGGTQSLHTNALDEALALPSERAASIALRTQQILAHEIGIQDAADPFGGSKHLEAETDRLEREAQGYIDEIAKRGGPVPAIAERYYQGEIEKSAIKHQRALEAGEKVVVGVNRFVERENGAAKVKLLRINEKVRAARIRRVELAKKKRDAGKAKAAVARLVADAKGTANVMDSVLEAVRASVTLGEICHALRGEFGIFDATRPS